MLQRMKKYGAMKAYEYLEKNPEENMPKLLNWAKKIAPATGFEGHFKAIEEAMEDPDNNWYRLMLSLFEDVDVDIRKTLFENFILNANFDFVPRRDELVAKYDCNIPWAILMDPTSACNLKCTGCWAAEYGNKLNMSFDELDDIIEQGKELGIYMYLYSGGEPLVRKDDLIALANKHNDCVFLAFTNGTLIDDDFADELLRVKNFVPAISVEGFEGGTDFRRGEGTFKKVEAAMQRLQDRKVPFGISCCYTSQNIDEVSSEEYFDWMVDKGAKFCWFFTYMPIGVGAPTDLMATAEQREHMYHTIRKFRQTKPLFTIDFWNDGEYVGGCIAGGRNYCHINANGDIEPCAFIHYSDSNIRDTSLLQAFRNPLFMQYREGQPFNDNHLRPCPLLDNPGKLTHVVETSGAHSTDMEQPEDVRSLSDKCHDAAIAWADTAAKLWEQGHFDHASHKPNLYHQMEKERIRNRTE